jgi:hypothetical protein
MFVIYTGYPAAFAITGMLMIAALIPARSERRSWPAVRYEGNNGALGR